MSDRAISRWLGVTLSALGVIATLRLAATGRLTLYIHPRYIVFTVVMAVIGGALVIAAVVFTTRSASRRSTRTTPGKHDHDHDHDHDRISRSGVRRRLAAGGAVALVAASGIVLIALPPASLSTGALSAAELDTTSATTLDDAPALVGGDSTTFTVKDWAALLRQGLTAGELTGMSADVIGFVAPDPSGDADTFYLARFSVTCCAVDAQPIAIPVESSRWSDSLEEGGWVRVQGAFIDSASPGAPTVLSADTVETIDEPAEPYVF